MDSGSTAQTIPAVSVPVSSKTPFKVATLPVPKEMVILPC